MDVAGWNNVSASSALKLGQSVVIYQPVKAAGTGKNTAKGKSKAPAGQKTNAPKVAAVKP
jgi:hypothetical protein